RLRNRADVDALQAYLEEKGATIVDPAGEYYDDYYAVFFLDPDGMKLEGMRYGERHAKTARKRDAAKRAKSASKKKRQDTFRLLQVEGSLSAAPCPAPPGAKWQRSAPRTSRST